MFSSELSETRQLNKYFHLKAFCLLLKHSYVLDFIGSLWVFKSLVLEVDCRGGLREKGAVLCLSRQSLFDVDPNRMRKRERRKREIVLQIPRSVWKEGQEVFPDAGAEISLQVMEKTVVKPWRW